MISILLGKCYVSAHKNNPSANKKKLRFSGRRGPHLVLERELGLELRGALDHGMPGVLGLVEVVGDVLINC